MLSGRVPGSQSIVVATDLSRSGHGASCVRSSVLPEKVLCAHSVDSNCRRLALYPGGRSKVLTSCSKAG